MQLWESTLQLKFQICRITTFLMVLIPEHKEATAKVCQIALKSNMSAIIDDIVNLYILNQKLFMLKFSHFV